MLAGTIAWLQYRNGVFRPKAMTSIEEPTRGRVAVRITNHGGAAGMVERIELLTSRHEQAPLVDHDWEGWGSEAPLPFVLPGKASAVLVLKPKEVLPKDARIRVWSAMGNPPGASILTSLWERWRRGPFCRPRAGPPTPAEGRNVSPSKYGDSWAIDDEGSSGSSRCDCPLLIVGNGHEPYPKHYVGAAMARMEGGMTAQATPKPRISPARESTITTKRPLSVA